MPARWTRRFLRRPPAPGGERSDPQSRQSKIGLSVRREPDWPDGRAGDHGDSGTPECGRGRASPDARSTAAPRTSRDRPGIPSKGKSRGNLARFLPAKSCNGLCLPPEVALIPVNRLQARQIDKRVFDIQRQLAFANQVPDVNARLPQRTIRRQPSAANRHRCLFQPQLVLRQTSAARLEMSPASLVHRTDRSAPWREPEIGVVDPKEQSMLCPRCEHAVWLEAAFGNQVIDHNAYVGLVRRSSNRAASWPTARAVGVRAASVALIPAIEALVAAASS